MATPPAEKTNYPVINVAAWRTLRKKFQENPPKGALNPSYLSTVLSYNRNAALSLIRQLQRIGLIDSEAKLTERAYRWRDDSTYKAVCEEIREEVYPQEVRDLFHSPNVRREDVERWFASDTKSGKGTASNYTRFYVMLLEGDTEKLEAVAAPKAGRAAGAKVTTPRQRSNGAKAEAASSREPETSASNTASMADGHESERQHTAPRRSGHSFEPSLNINIQIHIPAEASTDQIDQIFKSMAKHLYQREVGE